MFEEPLPASDVNARWSRNEEQSKTNRDHPRAPGGDLFALAMDSYPCPPNWEKVGRILAREVH